MCTGGLNNLCPQPATRHAVLPASTCFAGLHGGALVGRWRACPAAISSTQAWLPPLLASLSCLQRCCGALPAARWRKLEGSDPTTYEMILKIQARGWVAHMAGSSRRSQQQSAPLSSPAGSVLLSSPSAVFAVTATCCALQLHTASIRPPFCLPRSACHLAQALQKRLIAKTEEVVEKDLQIQAGLGRGLLAIAIAISSSGAAAAAICAAAASAHHLRKNVCRAAASAASCLTAACHAAGAPTNRVLFPTNRMPVFCRRRSGCTWSSSRSWRGSRGLRQRSSSTCTRWGIRCWVHEGAAWGGTKWPLEVA